MIGMPHEYLSGCGAAAVRLRYGSDTAPEIIVGPARTSGMEAFIVSLSHTTLMKATFSDYHSQQRRLWFETLPAFHAV